MACLLDRDNVLSVYGDIYETVLDHINNTKKAKFDATKYIKDLYTDIAGSNDPKFALEVAQAAPEIMLQVIATRKNVREYFVKNKISQDPISEMSIRFEDVNAVKKFVTGEKETLDEVKEKIKSSNRSKKQKPSENPTDNTINYSNVQNKSKVEDPLTSTYNFAVASDPDLLSEEDKDRQDPQKALSYLIFKQLILISDNKPANTEDVVYQGVPLALRPIAIKQFPTRADGTSLLVDNDKKHLEKNENYDGVLLAVSDTEGNIMYFNEDGSLTDDTETGRPVYQYLRDIKLDKGKLQLVNRSGYAYTLVSAEDIVEREDNLIKERNGLGMLIAEKEAKIKKIKAEQRAKLNDLYRLRKHINENPEQVVTLKITGGSFGNFKNLYVPLSETELDLDAITNPIVGGGKSGFVQVAINKSYPGVTVDHPVYLQRGDMDRELAEKIATILTTDATYRGSQLSPNARRTYAEIFLGDNIKKNNIEILTPEVNGITTLTVSLNGEKLDLTDPLAKDKIVEHLLRAVKLKNGDTKPANINYTDAYVNKEITDYTVKDGKITRQVFDYFDFIKPYLKLEFSKESGAFFVNSNAYLSYAVPTEILPVKAKNYDVAAITPVSKRTKKEVIEVKDSEDVEVTPGEIVYNLKPVYNNYQVNDNVKKIPVTINVAVDFTKGDAKVAKEKAKNHIPVTLSKKSKTKKTFDNVEVLAANIVKNLNKYKADTVTVTGNHVVDMFRAGYSQKDVDTFMGILFDKIVSSPNLITPITKLVTTGETGISEGAIKAAAKAGIGVEVTVPKGWSHTVYWAKSKSGTFRASDEDQFLERFGVAPKKKTAAKKTSKRATAKTKAAKSTPKKGATAKKTTVEANKKVDKQINLGAQASLLQRLRVRKDIYPDQDKLNRIETAERKLGNFFERLFTTKAERDSIFDWWKNHPMSKHIPLEVITEVVNSNAFATWSQHGITLHMANKATPIDLYHEAWHGFTQLFLTPEEKTNLYDELRKLPKWATASNYEIEEALAEDYRNYITDNTLFTGIVGRIYKKIRDFLRAMFGKITRQDMTRPRDIAVVKELYDKLYKGEILDLKPSMDNIIFTRLNRDSRVIKMLDKQDEEGSPFTIDESNKLVNLLDSLTAAEIDYYNSKNNSSTGAVRLFSTLENRVDLYGSLKQTLSDLLEELMNDYVSIADQNDQLDTQKQLRSNIYLLERALANFGDIEKSVNEKQGRGLIAYHIKKSRFNIIQEELIEDPTDLENTRILQDYKGNVIDPKKLAAPSTLSIISSIFKKERQEDGTVTESLDVFGLPELEDITVMWNKLSRILAGSFDYAEMYRRLQDNLENYPDFEQILNMLRAPEIVKTNDSLQFKIETNFWQDFKKPRVRFIQYNINKTITQRKRKDEDGREIPEVANFDTSVTRATPAIYSVIKDWKSNFTTTNTSVNSYVTIEETIPVLNTEKILEDFGDKNGVFKSQMSREFLEALGVYLDRRSGELNALFNDKALFARAFQLQLIFDTIKKVNAASFSTDYAQVAAAEEFKRDPLTYLINGVPKALQDKTGKLDVRTRLRMLAELQNFYSDGYSNFSVLSPEGNRLWEQVVDNTVTRIVTSINQADNWFELTDSLSDPNGRFKHMRWLADKNNVYSKHSVLLNSVFHLDDPLAENYGEKRKVQKGTRQIPAELVLNNVGGTQLVVKNSNNNDSIGNATASLDATSKFLQEIHTMLLSGVEEFMRHASKNTAMAMSAENLITYPGKTDKHLYVDIDMFKPQNNGEGETEAFYILLNYISGELERIRRYKANDKYHNYEGYNRSIISDGKKVAAAEVFTAFDDVLSKDMKQELYDLEGDLIEAVDNDSDLRDRLKAEVFDYFEKETQANLTRLQEARFVDTALYERGAQLGLNQNQVDEVLMKAYTYNSWIHKFETLILAYGDLVQYNHDKEEFHKRNAGLGSGGKGFRSDVQAQAFINGLEKIYAKKQRYKVRTYDGTFVTAILKEKEIEKSVYYDEYLKELTDSIYKRVKNKTKAKQLAETALGEYLGMKEGDGQGVITFESYRIFKQLEGNWSDQQELLYQKVANGENITAEEVIQYFPPYKLQYFGNIQSEGLPITSFHKFSLAPIIPFTTEPGSLLNELHDKLMTDQVDYAVFQTGSKVSHIGTGDNIINSDGTINKDEPLTKNIIFAEYLKNQTEVNSEYKGKSIFSTQLRKLILEGLYEKGVIDTTEEDKITEPRVRKYLSDVAEYTETLKVELLNEIGFEKQGDKYVPRNSDSLEKLVDLIRENLEIDDVIGDHLLEFIDVLEDGTLQYDLSLHPEALKIEKLVMSIINKKLIKQQVNGEPLVQVSAALYTGAFKRSESKLKLGTDEDIKKYKGSNILPSYYKKADGFTAAMKVMIALQGDYVNLLNLEYKGERIGTIDRLNEAIKDDEWLDANNGANRKAITLVGVRIPVQGLNSMEFMEVYHFLPPQAGNIIVPPSEIVAKSGADFDIDKLTLYMANINQDGLMPERMFKNASELNDYLLDSSVDAVEKQTMLTLQKAYIQNELIDDIKNILELPQNYASLITPNGTFLLKDLADELSQFVMDYDPFQVKNGEQRVNAKDKDKKAISPTRVLETLYNIYKHESNVVGKNTLGLGAQENTFHTLINSLETPGGIAMPDTFMHSNEMEPRESLLWLKHNTVNKGGKKLISIASRYDVNNQNKIADVISQMMNGWVDVEKDAWIFFIQGNYEVAPMLLYLVKAGVPVKEAVYFVSQPLVREYVKQQRLASSTFADVLGKKPESRNFVKYEAATNTLKKYLEPNLADKLSKNRARYDFGLELANDIFDTRKDKFFTEDEMLKLIKEFKKNPNVGKSQLSVAMFLHYLQIEQQITGFTRLKMASRPDTSTKSTGGDVEQAEANLESLVGESKIEENLLPLMRNDSVISSLFNNSLALSLNERLFPLRFNKAISNYLIGKNRKLRDDSESIFGQNKSDVFVNTFRNDIVSFLYQQAARRFNLTESYKSYTLKKKVPVAYVDLLQFGAYVKKDANGQKTMYIDQNALKKDFESGVWRKNSDAQDSYVNRGLYPLTEAHFHSDHKTNVGEYIKFVTEREYLRSVYTKAEISKTPQFKAELKTVKQENPGFTADKAKAYTYEKILAIKALENTLNPYHMFKDKQYAYAIQFQNIVNKHAKGFVKNYALLSRMKVESDANKTMYNLYVGEKDFTNDISNLFYKNLEDLSNPAVKKVTDEVENQYISDFFAKLPLYAFMQTGINKTKFSFTNIVDYTEFLYLVNEESQKLRKALENNTVANKILDVFYNRFLKENSKQTRGRYKNYLFNIDLDKLSELPTESTEDVNIDERFRMEEIADNTFIYDNAQATPDIYKEISNKNSDVTIAYAAPITVIQGKEKPFGDSLIREYSEEMSVAFPTALRYYRDGMATLDPDKFPAIKRAYDVAIQRLVEVQESGSPIAFPVEGIGDSEVMPQELFVYLSKELYQKFGYLNPGSTMYTEIKELIGENQGITDREILEELGLDEDPFTCKL